MTSPRVDDHEPAMASSEVPAIRPGSLGSSSNRPSIDRPLRVLDLFSGLDGWTAAFRACPIGHDIVSVDLDPRFGADLRLDLRTVGPLLEALGDWRPDLITASPECASFSTMAMGKSWKKGQQAVPRTTAASDGMSMVLATLRAVLRLEPRYYVIENPRARLRSLELLEGLPRWTVWYCRLGETRAKPTDLWGRLPPAMAAALESGRFTCSNGTKDHVPAPRGSRTGTQGGVTTAEAGRIPGGLSELLHQAVCPARTPS